MNTRRLHTAMKRGRRPQDGYRMAGRLARFACRAQRENAKLRRELADMTEARDALYTAYAVLKTQPDAQRAALWIIAEQEVGGDGERMREKARAAGMADKPGVSNE